MLKSRFRAWFAFYVLTLSFGFIFLITVYPSAQGVATNDTILGFLLGTGLSAIISFYFGSSDENNKDPKKPTKQEVAKDEKV